MSNAVRSTLLLTVMACLLWLVGTMQSWSVSLSIINLCLISSVMALGVNMQWGYAGLFNVGVMGFAALGGVAAVLVSKGPVAQAWQIGAGGLAISLLIAAAATALVVVVIRKLAPSVIRNGLVVAITVIGLILFRMFMDPTVDAIESVNPAKSGFLGGLDLPIVVSWVVGGLFAAAAAWLIGHVALGLRSDYLAIATLGISEIVIAFLKNEDWLTRGVKNVTGLPRPVPYEIDLQVSPWFIGWVDKLNAGTLAGLGESERIAALNTLVVDASGIFVKLCYAGLFLTVLIIVYWLSERALRSPWGRMMRAMRDNEEAADAMGKDVTRRRRQLFIIGSGVVGIAGAMLTTIDGQFTPGTYNPLRFTFLIWVMVIVGGSGNNLGSVLGAFLIWFVWVEAEPVGIWIMQLATHQFELGPGATLRMMEAAPHMRLFLMGLLLLVVLRFSPKGLIPEVIRR